MDEHARVTFFLVRHGRTLLNQRGQFRGRSPVSLDSGGVLNILELSVTPGHLPILRTVKDTAHLRIPVRAEDMA